MLKTLLSLIPYKTIINKFGLTKILIGLCIVLGLGFASTGYLLVESYKSNGVQTQQITTLESELKKCQGEISFITDTKDTIVANLDKVEERKEILEKEFSELEAQLKNKQCIKRERTNEEISTDVVDDINDTYRLLDRAHCLSNGSCGNP